MKLTIRHDSSADLIVQSNNQHTMRLPPLTFIDRLCFWRAYALNVSENELLIIRTSTHVEPDKTPIRDSLS